MARAADIGHDHWLVRGGTSVGVGVSLRLDRHTASTTVTRHIVRSRRRVGWTLVRIIEPSWRVRMMGSTTGCTCWTVGLEVVSVTTGADWGSTVVAGDVRAATRGDTWSVHNRVRGVSGTVRTVDG
jgi:hypothetical protein